MNSVAETLVLTAVQFVAVLLALVAISYPVVAVGFAAGVVVRPAVRTGQELAGRVSRPVQRLFDDSPGPSAVDRFAQGGR